MKRNDKKLPVLLSLEKFEQPATLAELLEDLGDGYAERTVRRWLAEFVRFGVVERLGQKRSTRYRLSAQGVYAAVAGQYKQQSVSFEQLASKAIRLGSQPLSKRLKTDYDARLLDDYHPNRQSYFSAEQLEAMMQAAQRCRPHSSEGSYARQVEPQLLVDLTYHSIRLEGSELTRPNVEALIEQNTPSQIDRQQVVALNHIEALRHIIENAHSLGIDVTGICTIHFLLCDALIDSHYAGQVRDKGLLNDYTSYIPPEDPQRLQRLLGQLCAKAMHIDNPLEQSLFLLLHIGYLQPFVAANRRTARICANIPLIQHNLVPMTFEGISQSDYTTALIALFEQKDPRPMAQLYYQHYLTVCSHYDKTADETRFDELRVKYRPQLREAIRQIVTERLTGDAITAKISDYSQAHIEAADRLAFEQTLRQDIDRLTPQRIAGTGLSRRQLNEWQELVESSELS